MVTINCILMRVEITVQTIRVLQQSKLLPLNTELTELAHRYSPITPLTTPPTTPGLAPLLFLTGVSLDSVIKQRDGGACYFRKGQESGEQ